MNTIKEWWDKVRDKVSGKTKKNEQNRQTSLAGRTTSGYLGQGERDRLFRTRDKFRSRVHRRQ